MSAEPIRVAVIGCGAHSRNALQPNLARLTCFDYVAACDLQEDLAVDCARRFGARSHYTDHRRMLDECDPEAVLVVGPPQMHHQLGLECVRRGLHVFVEKPTATTVEDALELAEAAEAQGKPGMVGTMWRHARANVMARQLTEAEEFGRVLLFSGAYFTPGQRSDIWGLGSAEKNYLSGQAIHIIDCMRFLMGEVEELDARSTIGTDGAFAYAVALRFHSGASGTLSLTSFTNALTIRISVHGQNGQYVEVTNNENVRAMGAVRLPGARGGYADLNVVEWDQGSAYRGHLRQGYVEELTAFASSIRDGAPTGATLRDGAEDLRVVYAIKESADQGGPIRF